MPGANYMGGKRNAAKARTKDSAGRIQKGFFSKRRLDMLSKGLAPNQRERGAPICAGAREPGQSDIGLTHAKQGIDTSPHILGFIPSPARFFPHTPNSRKHGRCFNHESSAGNSTRSSRVIEALDTSEPLFMREAMDRILALPDLASLPVNMTRHGTVKSYKGFERPMPHGGREQERERERDSSVKHKKQRITHTENDSSGGGSSIMEIRRIDSLKEGDMRSEDFPNTSDIDVSPLRAIINQTDLDLAQEEFWSLDIDDDEDLGYSDFRAGLDGDDWILAGKSRVTSSPKKEFTFTSSSYRPSSALIEQEHFSQRFAPALPSIPSPRTPDFHQTDGCVQDPHSSQNNSLVNFHAGTTHRFSSNNLFDHEDPWHTIGIILGLSPTSHGDVTKSPITHRTAIVGSRTNSPNIMLNLSNGSLTRHKPSLPPSSPPADRSTSPYYDMDDRRTYSLELYDLPATNDDYADLPPTLTSNLSTFGSHPVLAARHSPTSNLNLTGYGSSPAISVLPKNHVYTTTLSSHSPTDSALMTTNHNSDIDFSDAATASSDSKHHSLKLNANSTLSSRGSTSRVEGVNSHGVYFITESHATASSNLALGALSLLSPAVVHRSSPLLSAHGMNDPNNRVLMGFPPPAAPAHPHDQPSTHFLDNGTTNKAVVTSSSPSKPANPIEPVPIQLNGVFQGPCLFPEDSDLDSDGDES